VATVGPELAITRSYNSRDPRTSGAFGAGWSSMLDAEVRPAAPGSSPELVTVRYPTGQEVTFGRNPDGKWDAGSGRFSTLISSGGYQLIDKNGTKFVFGHSYGSGRYGLSSIEDAAGRKLTLTYDSNHRVVKITSASGRSLYLTWFLPSGGGSYRVRTVKTDPADPADPASASTWTYNYDGPRLVSVCPPETPTQCHTYTYDQAETLSLHPTAVLDAEPRTYLRLGSSTGTVPNAAIDSLHLATGQPSNVGTGSGPFPGSTAATFNGSSSYVKVNGDEHVALARREQTVSLWFKTPAGSTKGGVLLAAQETTVSSTPDRYIPILYVGTDGKIRGKFYTGDNNALTGPTVNDGQWHHVVLTATHSEQKLYVDGQEKDSTTLAQASHGGHLGHVYIGTGRWTGRPATSGTYGYFNGSIAEVALFDRPLTPDQVTTLNATGKTPTRPLTSVARPSGALVATLDYDQSTGAVDALTDANGGTWTYADPQRSGSDLTYAAAVLAAGPNNYWRFNQPNGTIAVNQVNGQTAQLSSVTLGVSGPFTNAQNPPTAAGFDGEKSAVYIDDAVVDTTQPYTVMTWVKLDQVGKFQSLVVMNGDPGSAFKLSYSQNGKWLVEIARRAQNGTVSWFYVDSNHITVTPGVWTHLTVTVDTVSRVATIYVNGVENDAEVSDLPLNVRSSRAMLGTQYGEDYLDGTLAEVATFPRALSAAEIKAIYDAYHASTGSPVKTITTTDPMGATSSTVHDLLNGGRVIRSTDTRGYSTYYGYDTHGFLRSVTDPNGNTTITGRDVRGNVVSESTCQDQSENRCSTVYYTHYPNNQDRVLNPDPRNDMVLTVRDGRSSNAQDNRYRTTFTYDGAGNRTKVTDALGRVTETTYSDGGGPAVGGGTVPPGLPLVVTKPNGARYTVQYYKSGDAAVAVDASGKRTEYKYDGLGQLIEMKEISDSYPDGLVTTFTYDKNGRLTSTTGPSVLNRVTGAVHTARTTFEYNADGQLTRTLIEDLTGGDAPRETRKGYNALGQLAWESDSLGRRTVYTYDLRGNRVTQTPTDADGDPVGKTVELAYDGERHLLTTTVKDYDGQGTDLTIESRDYDPAGRLTRIVDAMGWETRYTYFDNNLLATTTRYDASTGQSFLVESNTYDEAGLLVKEETANGTLTTVYTVDAVGRTVSETVDPTGVNRTTTYVYDRDDNVVSIVVNDGSGQSQRTDLLYDLAGRLVAETTYPDGDTGPVGRWKLDETSGLTAADSAGNSPATATASGVSWSTERGGSVVLDGEDGWLTTAGPVLDTTRSYTVAAWVKMDEPDPSVDGEAYAVSQDGTVRGAFFLGFDDIHDRWTFYLCQPNDEQDDGCTGGARPTSPPAFGSWTHLAGVYDKGAKKIHLYVNGSLQATRDANAEWQGAMGPLRIGSGLWDKDVHDRFPGSIDDVQVYQAALSAAQIAQIYNGTLAAADKVISRSSFGYDQRGLAVRITDPNGVTVTHEYDEAGREAVVRVPVWAEEAGGAPVWTESVTMIGYDTFGAVTETSDPKGRTTVIAYNANGQPISQTLPDYTPPDGGPTISGAQTLTGYDELGRVVWVRDPLGNQTDYGYDALGRLVWERAPNGGETFYEYNLAGQVTKVIDPTGAVTTATYDFLGRRLTSSEVVRQPSLQTFTTTYEYWPSGLLKKVTPPGRNGTVYHYNAVGEVTRVIDPAGNHTLYEYDFAGRQTRVILPDGSGSRVTYDGAGRPVVTQALATDGTVLTTNSFAYDPAGNVVGATDANGHTTTFVYDTLGRVVELTEPVSATESIVTTYGYDVAGDLTRFTNGNGHDFLTTYNSWGLVESVIEPATAAHPDLADRTFTTVYDRAGRPVKQLLPGGVTVTNTYDAMGQLTQATGSGAEVATASRTFAYDLAGRPIQLSAPGGSNTLTWDDRGLLLSVTGPSGNSSFAYTPDGLLAQRTDAAGVTDYGYDPAGRLATITNPAADVDVSFTYTPLSQVEKINYNGGAKIREFTYDELHRLKTDTLLSITPPAAPVQVAKITYGYDNNSNITRKDTEGFNGTIQNVYTYDWADRLTSWTEIIPGTSQTTVGYSYDGAGNRIQAGDRSFTYDERNRLVSDSLGTTYTYTARGTRASEITPTGTFLTKADAFGQVIEQDGPGGTQTYEYDGLGRVVKPGFAYTGLGNDLASDGTTSYVRDPFGDLVAASTGATKRLVWTDQHQDVVGQFTPTSTGLTGSATYDPLGRVLATSGLIGSLGYQSEYTDQVTGRVNMHARWYNPDTGQFDTRDPVSLSPIPDSIRANRYAYGDANPLSSVDPTGHWSWNPITAVTNAAKAVTNTVKSVATSAYNTVTSAATYVYNTVKSVATTVYNAAATAVRTVITTATNIAKTVVNTVTTVATNIVNTVKNVTNTVVNTVKNVVSTAVNTVTKVATTVVNVAQQVAHNVAETARQVAAAIAEATQQARQWVTEKIEDAKQLVIDGVTFTVEAGRAALAAAQRAAETVGNVVVDAYHNVAEWVNEHKAEIAGFAVGLVVGGVCGAAIGWTGVGAVACGALAGAAGSFVTSFMNGERGWDLVKSTAFGGLLGAIGGPVAGRVGSVLGKFVPAPVRAGAAKLGDFVRGAGAKAGQLAKGAGTALRKGTEKVRSLFSRGCRNSFAAETPVLLASGAVVPIKDIQLGDMVVATDPETGQTSAEPVTVLHLNLDTELADVTVSLPADGDGAADQVAEGKGGRSTRGPTATIETTADHPFWDATAQEWVAAGDLVPGRSTLLTDGGQLVEVVAVRTYRGERWMHNLTVANLHTYYVLAGNTSVLVHNCGGNISGHSSICTCEGIPGREIILDRASFEQARNTGLELLGEINPATRTTIIGSLPQSKAYGRVVGFETTVNGVWKQFRIDWDPVKGAHINVRIGKKANAQRWAIRWPGTEDEFLRLLKGNT